MRSLYRRRLNPDLAAVPFDRLAADGQADSRSFVLVACVEPLKRLKDLLRILRRNADPVVFDAKNPMLPFVFRCQTNLRRPAAGELQCVADQILIELGEQPGVAPLFRQRVAFDLGAGPLNSDLQRVNRAESADLQRNQLSFQVRPSGARKLE